MTTRSSPGGPVWRVLRWEDFHGSSTLRALSVVLPVLGLVAVPVVGPACAGPGLGWVLLAVGGVPLLLGVLLGWWDVRRVTSRAIDAATRLAPADRQAFVRHLEVRWGRRPMRRLRRAVPLAPGAVDWSPAGLLRGTVALRLAALVVLVAGVVLGVVALALTEAYAAAPVLLLGGCALGLVGAGRLRRRAVTRAAERAAVLADALTPDERYELLVELEIAWGPDGLEPLRERLAHG